MKFKVGDRVVFADPAGAVNYSEPWCRYPDKVWVVTFVEPEAYMGSSDYKVWISIEGTAGCSDESTFEFAIEEKIKLL